MLGLLIRSAHKAMGVEATREAWMMEMLTWMLGEIGWKFRKGMRISSQQRLYCQSGPMPLVQITTHQLLRFPIDQGPQTIAWQLIPHCAHSMKEV